jgi:hypothetical protein
MTPAGTRIRLMAIRGPRGWLTTEAWVMDFFAARTAAEAGTTPAPLAKARARSAVEFLRNQGF